MPAKTVLFDQRVKTLHDFGSSPHNFISFNPQSRLIALAGFGNLAGKLDIFDRRTLTKIAVIDAPNTSHCEWSPDGRFLLTATLSPRLRVDNGIKIWHCSGTLVHVQPIDELYQASWRPSPLDSMPAFPSNGLPPSPAPSPSVASHAGTASPTPTKPAGAYRPPGARGLATPTIFKREDEGGAAYVASNGTSTPPRHYSRSPAPGSAPNNGHPGQNGAGRGGRRHVPGAPPPLSPPLPVEGGGDKRGRKRKEGGKKKDGGEGTAPPTPNGLEVPPPILVVDPSVPSTPDGSLDPIAKKIRNLNKKVRSRPTYHCFCQSF